MYSERTWLKWLLDIAELTGQLVHWHMRLSNFNFEILYKKGLNSLQAYALSRLHLLGLTAVPVYKDILTNQHHSDNTPNSCDRKNDLNAKLSLSPDTSPSFVSNAIKEIRVLQDDDKFYRSICACLGEREGVPFAHADDNVWLCSVDRFEQVIIPQFLVPRILHLSHRAKVAGY